MIRTIFLVCCSLAFSQFLRAAQPRGQVVGWGVNIAGEATGIPSIPFSNSVAVMTGNYFATNTVTSAGRVLNDAVAISAGFSHSLVLCSDGTVIGFGDNFFGKAVGFTNDYPYRANAQVKISDRILSNVVSVAAGRDFSLALKKDGTIVAWGEQERIETVPTRPAENIGGNPIIDPVTGMPVRPESGETKKSVSIGLSDYGTVVTRVENQEPIPLSNVLAIAAEWGGSWVLKGDGTVVGWTSQPSNYSYGQLFQVENLSNVVAIAVGSGGYNTRGVALKRDGTVAHWGGESIYKDATPPAGLSNVVAVAAGDAHTLALKTDGTIVGWGFNKEGQATGIATIKDPYISAGQVAIEGRVLSNVVSIAAGRGYSLALEKDGTVIAWGRMVNNRYPATVPAGLSNVVAIAAGDNFCLAITTNSAVADKFRQK